MGYYRAGFDVVGVDINPMKHYPFPFIQADANTWPLEGFDAIHASPPCQDHMLTPHGMHGTGWMLDHTRQRLLAQGRPWVIENVPGRGHIRADYRLCGCQFGLQIRRERWFETSWEGFQMMEPHRHDGPPVVSVVGHGMPTWVRGKWKAYHGREPGIADYRAAMGIDWMNRGELSQAIPPAYTEFIGHALMANLKANERTGAPRG
jgi:DNA (cytosine-5)-methyltransferase 1